MKRGILSAIYLLLIASIAQAKTYEITNWTELRNVRNDLDGDYFLMNNLDDQTSDFPGYVAPNFTPIGLTAGWKPFTGTFNGLGHYIKGIRMKSASMDGAGLFGFKIGRAHV